MQSKVGRIALILGVAVLALFGRVIVDKIVQTILLPSYPRQELSIQTPEQMMNEALEKQKQEQIRVFDSAISNNHIPPAALPSLPPLKVLAGAYNNKRD